MAVSKLIDTYDNNVSSALKQKVAGWVAEPTCMEAMDFFDLLTHQGFLDSKKIIVLSYLQKSGTIFAPVLEAPV